MKTVLQANLYAVENEAIALFTQRGRMTIAALSLGAFRQQEDPVYQSSTEPAHASDFSLFITLTILRFITRGQAVYMFLQGWEKVRNATRGQRIHLIMRVTIGPVGPLPGAC
jgi:hypothetical protein